jgi:hypothetical protein
VSARHTGPGGQANGVAWGRGRWRFGGGPSSSGGNAKSGKKKKKASVRGRRTGPCATSIGPGSATIARQYACCAATSGAAGRCTRRAARGRPFFEQCGRPMASDGAPRSPSYLRPVRRAHAQWPVIAPPRGSTGTRPPLMRRERGGGTGGSGPRGWGTKPTASLFPTPTRWRACRRTKKRKTIVPPAPPRSAHAHPPQLTMVRRPPDLEQRPPGPRAQRARGLARGGVKQVERRVAGGARGRAAARARLEKTVRGHEPGDEPRRRRVRAGVRGRHPFPSSL